MCRGPLLIEHETYKGLSSTVKGNHHDGAIRHITFLM
jgi:hypothetical protein